MNLLEQVRFHIARSVLPLLRNWRAWESLSYPSPGGGYHATAQVPSPLSNDLATAISGVFKQRANPFPAPR